MAPPVLEGFTKATAAGASSLTLTKPTGVAVGDLLVIIVGNDNTSDTAQWDDVTLKPTGFDLLREGGDSVIDCHIAIFTREADGSEGATINVSAESAEDYWGYYIRVSNPDPTTPINAVNNTQISSSLPTTSNDVDTSVDDCLAFLVVGFDGADAGTWVLSGDTAVEWTIEDSATAGSGPNGGGGFFATRTVATAGSSGNVTFDADGSDGNVYTQFAIAPGGGGGGTEITATSASLTLTAFNAATKRTINCTAGALTLTAFNATVKRTIGAASASLALTSFNATVKRTINATAGALALTSFNATVSFGTNIACTTASLTLTGFGVSLKRTINATAASLTLTSFNAGVSFGTTISCTAASLVLTGQPASIKRTIRATAATLTLTSFNTVVTYGAGTTISCTVASLSLNAFEATVLIGVGEQTVALAGVRATHRVSPLAVTLPMFAKTRLARVDYFHANGSVFNIPFPYMEVAHLVVTLGKQALEEGIDYTVSGDTLTLTQELSGQNNQVLTILRQTPHASVFTPFVGALVRVEAIKTALTQILYYTEEVQDKAPVRPVQTVTLASVTNDRVVNSLLGVTASQNVSPPSVLNATRVVGQPSLSVGAVELVLGSVLNTHKIAQIGVSADFSWTRTWEATESTSTVYLTVLPFAPGEWDAQPINQTYATPFKFNPDGSAALVAYLDSQSTSGTKTVTPKSRGDVAKTLPPLPTIVVKQLNQASATYNVHLQTGWIEVNVGVVAHRVFAGRPVNSSGQVSDFAVYAWFLYYDGVEVRREILLVAHDPSSSKAGIRNYPLFALEVGGGAVRTDVTTDIAANNNGKVGGQYAFSHVVDNIVYVKCNERAGHPCGPYGYDVTRVSGGNGATLVSDETTYLAGGWAATWAMPAYGPSSGVWLDYGVCKLDEAHAFNNNNKDALKALQTLCNDWIVRPNYLTKTDGSIGEPRENHDVAWARSGLGQVEGTCRTSGGCPDGKLSTSETPALHGGKTAEDGAHMIANAVHALMEYCPTSMFLHILTMRAQSMMLYTGYRFLSGGVTVTNAGELRKTARTIIEMLAAIPYVGSSFRAELINRINEAGTVYPEIRGFRRIHILFFKAGFAGVPYRNFVTNGGGDTFPNFAPWQDGLFFGAALASHRSGWSGLEMEADEIKTAKETMKWEVDNCFRKIGTTWECGYHTYQHEAESALARTLVSVSDGSPAVATTDLDHKLVSGTIAQIVAEVNPRVTVTGGHGIPYSLKPDRKIINISGVSGDMSVVNGERAVQVLDSATFRILDVDTTGGTFVASGRYDMVVVITEATGTMASDLNATGFDAEGPTPRFSARVTGAKTFELYTVGATPAAINTLGKVYDANSAITHHPYTAWTGGDVLSQGVAGLEWIWDYARANDILTWFLATHATPHRWLPQRPTETVALATVRNRHVIGQPTFSPGSITPKSVTNPYVKT